MYNKPTSVSYIDAGFNKFFSRSITSNSLSSLQQMSQAAGALNINFDHYSTSGSLGDKIQVGSVWIDGIGKVAVKDDAKVDVVALGEVDGKYGLIFYNSSGKRTSDNTGITESKYDADGNIYYKAGELSNGTYGVAFYNTTGGPIAINDGLTEYKYDDDGINYYQAGLLPDGTYGIIVTKPGIDISTVF